MKAFSPQQEASHTQLEIFLMNPPSSGTTQIKDASYAFLFTWLCCNDRISSGLLRGHSNTANWL